MATNRKLGRTTDIRMAMLRNLTTDLLVYGKVETTLPRAKEVKSIVDSLISKENLGCYCAAGKTIFKAFFHMRLEYGLFIFTRDICAGGAKR